jgi:hypothetical protein
VPPPRNALVERNINTEDICNIGSWNRTVEVDQGSHRVRTLASSVRSIGFRGIILVTLRESMQTEEYMLSTAARTDRQITGLAALKKGVRQVSGV